jgi:cell division protein FtsL
MTFTLTQEHVNIGVILLLMAMQIIQWRQLNKAQSEIQKLWNQISVWNTMIAMKFLDTQKEIDKLNNKEDNDGK